ncbi:MAG: hypothetical protein Kilf2KO_31820 [Rhodospirillales bacterium]
MVRNLGSADRLLRVLLGVVLIVLPFVTAAALWSQPLYFYGALVIGLVLVATALFRFCPLYRLLGLSTCRI